MKKTKFENSLGAMDRISSLPQDLLNRILVRLPLRDAVRTSIFSSQWRFAWSKIPVINFNEECRLQLKGQPTSGRLSRIVDHVLLLHDSQTIQIFVLSRYLSGYNSDVDKWILILWRKGVEYLDLEFFRSVGDASRVSPYLFFCKQLRILRLHHCKLVVPPTFQGFPSLVRLNLESASVSEETINNLLPLCPLLNHLKLGYENLLSCLKINAPKLKFLSVNGAFQNLDFISCVELEGVDIIMPQVIHNAGRGELINTSILEKVLGCLPSLVNLTSRCNFLKFLSLGALKDRLPNSFENLKILSFTINFRDIKQISAALCIIKSSPNLQTIYIEATWIPCYPVIYADIRDFFSYCALHKLKRIKMNPLCTNVLQMDFLKFLLANAPTLEAVSITIAREAKLEEAMILKSLLSFHRASASLKNFTVD